MLTVHNTEAIRQIESAIGYTFNDKRLLVQVFTRKTFAKIDPEAPDNEVLEFYGDTLMSYHVTNYFVAKYAHMLDDGLFFMRTVEQFTDMRSHYVCNHYLTNRVKELKLARFLRAQNPEAELRRDNQKAYADLFESLIGAVYLDSNQNDEFIRAFILRHLNIEPKADKLTGSTLTSVDDGISEDEYTAAEIPLEEPATEADLPAEAVVPPMSATVESAVSTEGMLANESAMPASIPAEPTPETAAPLPVETASAESPSETVTETAAEVNPTVQIKRDELAAFCLAQGYELPVYGEAPPNAPNAKPVAACTVKYRDAKGKPIKISLNDSGKTLEDALEGVAAMMLKKLQKQVSSTAKPSGKKQSNEKSTVQETKPTDRRNPPVPTATSARPTDEVKQPVSAPETTVPVEEVAVETVVDTPVAEIAEALPATGSATDRDEPATAVTAEAETAEAPSTVIAPPEAAELSTAPMPEAVMEEHSSKLAPQTADIPAEKKPRPGKNGSKVKKSAAKAAEIEQAPTDAAMLTEPSVKVDSEAVPATAEITVEPTVTPKPKRTRNRKAPAKEAEATASEASPTEAEMPPVMTEIPPVKETKSRGKRIHTKKATDDTSLTEVMDSSETSTAIADISETA